jgi:WD40 repeat protein
MGEVAVWSLVDGTKRVLVERGMPCTSLRFDADDKQVIVDRDGVAEVLGLDGTLTKLGTDSTVLLTVAENDLTKRVAKTAPNQVVAMLPGGTTRPIATFDKLVAYVALSPDGETVLVHDNIAIYAVPFAGGKLTKLVSYEAKLNSATWSPDGKTVALVGNLHEVLIVDLATGKVTALRGHTDQVYNCQFSRDGKSLLTAGDDGTARVWNIADGSAIVLRGHDDDVYRARFSPDERTVATASLDGSIRLWPLDRTGARTFAEGGEIVEMSLDQDLAMVRTTNGIARWNLATGTRELLFPRAGLSIGLPSPDGNHLVAQGADWTLELRDRNGKMTPLKGHTGFISHLEWSRDSRVLFSSSIDGTLRKWDIATGTSTTLIEGDAEVRGFAVSADGRVAAQVGDTAVMVKPDGTAEILGAGPAWCGTKAEFEPVKNRLLVQLCDRGVLLVDGKQAVNLATDGYHVSRLAVSTDGSRIAAAMGDRTVRLWDTQGKVLSVLRGHSDLVMDVAFSPTGPSSRRRATTRRSASGSSRPAGTACSEVTRVRSRACSGETRTSW